MKKTLMAMAVSTVIAALLISTSALAGEEIKLAQAVGQGGAATPASAGSSVSVGGAATAATTANYVAFGIIAAAAIGVVAGANPSTNH
ncbi:MAG: hypothetical protein L0Z73_16415 [Gammaproteobacteria bacterium]|nr:hypothetical protein [Gammaproteobacteria bacterium]